jgi:hypothetical protein
MGRYQFPAFKIASTPRYLVVWDLHWQIIDCRRLEPASDLRAAMTAAVEHAGSAGWNPEGETDYAFVFMRRQSERRLLMLTPRDPYRTTPQAFSPFNQISP